uniref:Putative oxygenase n=1 Tax=Streptomyces sp. 2238-SVT4 TaxID=681626 RepID=D5MRI3_9ACTN|nr:putative oxygenase [Streptomyces sp. 2238-SVT4]
MNNTTVSAVGFARPRPEVAEEFGAKLVALAAQARTEQGSIHTYIHRDIAEENLFVFYETWESQTDVDRHLDQPYMKEFLTSLPDYLQEELKVHQLALVGPLSEPAADPSDPAEMNQRYVDAYNARDIDGILAVYAPGAQSVWQPGQAVTAAEHRDTVVEFLKREPRLTADVRETYVVGDTAALVVDWSLEVPGAPELTGTGRGLDVLKRNAQGQWRYIITNPFGSP